MTGYHVSDGRLTLTMTDGSTQTLETIAPAGFEFRELTVRWFRWRGELRRVKPSSVQPIELVFYDDRIDGSIGYGGLYGTYESIEKSRYKISLTSIVTGSNDDTSARVQAQKILDAFNGVRDIEVRGADFVLRDDHGREQIILSPSTDPQN
jgi:hypothetical protein